MVTVSSVQRPRSHGRPDGWVISCAAWFCNAALTGRAGSQSGKTTNQNGIASNLASLAMLGAFSGRVPGILITPVHG
jgi:hypothetical protein